jgi:tripartite-type tricarboxylate transporter receptor subunit TctC
MRSVGIVTIGLAVAAGLAACANKSHSGSGVQGADAFNGKTITWIVPSTAGGGFDTTARLLAPALGTALGAHIAVEDQPGGEDAIGVANELSAGSSCSTLLLQGNPDLLFTFLTQKESYTNADFHAVTSYSISPAVWAVSKSSKFQTLGQLVSYAKTNPNKVRLSVNALTSGNYLSAVNLENATGAKFDIVPFNGGTEARNAIIAGTADVTNAGLFEAQAVASKIRFLAVDTPANNWKSLTGNAPTVDAAVGKNVPSEPTTFGAFVTQQCYTSNPGEYQALVQGFKKAVQSSAYKAKLASLDEQASLSVIDGATYDKQIAVGAQSLKAMMKANPKLFTVSGS